MKQVNSSLIFNEAWPCAFSQWTYLLYYVPLTYLLLWCWRNWIFYDIDFFTVSSWNLLHHLDLGSSTKTIRPHHVCKSITWTVAQFMNWTTIWSSLQLHAASMENNVQWGMTVCVFSMNMLFGVDLIQLIKQKIP